VLSSERGRHHSAPMRCSTTSRRTGYTFPGGEGYLGIYDTSDPDQLKIVEKVTTLPGAKTALLIPAMHRLFLAVSPGESKAVANLRSPLNDRQKTFQIAPPLTVRLQ
jgi:hypothetical protein